MSETNAPNVKICITENGPYMVKGEVKLSHMKGEQDGDHMRFVETGVYEHDNQFALCRCGRSKNPPFCDGTHIAAGFDGTATASREPFKDRAGAEVGPDLILLDDERCAFARFCHRMGSEVWSLTEASDDPTAREEAVRAASECTAGRLVAYDKESGRPYEIDYAPEIAVYEDPIKDCSGPLAVRGHIKLVAADKEEYELRNRYALCRCGNSRNKPFCDATHVHTGFNATLE